MGTFRRHCKQKVFAIIDRGDYVFVAAGANSAWLLPSDFVLDENVLGAGYYVLAMGEKDPELVSFQMSCVIPKSSFDKYLKRLIV